MLGSKVIISCQECLKGIGILISLNRSPGNISVFFLDRILSVEFDNPWHFQHFTQSIILKECLVIQSSLKHSERTESWFYLYLYPEDKLFIIPSLTEIKTEFVKELFKERLPISCINCAYSAFKKKKKKGSSTLLFCSQIVLYAWFNRNIYNIPELLPNVQLTILLLET